MAKKNITYLLGAGASYNSIPVVDSLNERMEFFLKIGLEYYSPEDSNLMTYYKGYNLKTILSKYDHILKNALKHKTVDTYAKKLFLQKNWDELNNLKEFLCLYFAFEQSPDLRKIPLTIELYNPKYESFKNHLNLHLDYRYDVFFAALLNPKKELPNNINIISWNYDHQLELAYMDYAQCDFNEAKSRLKIYPYEKSESGQIIKLNGSANQFISEDKVYTFEGYKSKNDLYIDTIHEIARQKSQKDKGEYALHFAWEGTKIQKKAISLAKELMNGTDELIIIGYSFPYFNRSVDIEILNQCTASLVKVQCLESDFKGVKQSLLDIWGEEFSDQVQYHDDLSQFYIPSVQFYNN